VVICRGRQCCQTLFTNDAADHKCRTYIFQVHYRTRDDLLRHPGPGVDLSHVIKWAKSLRVRFKIDCCTRTETRSDGYHGLSAPGWPGGIFRLQWWMDLIRLSDIASSDRSGLREAILPSPLIDELPFATAGTAHYPPAVSHTPTFLRPPTLHIFAKAVPKTRRKIKQLTEHCSGVTREPRMLKREWESE